MKLTNLLNTFKTPRKCRGVLMLVIFMTEYASAQIKFDQCIPLSNLKSISSFDSKTGYILSKGYNNDMIYIYDKINAEENCFYIHSFNCQKDSIVNKTIIYLPQSVNMKLKKYGIRSFIFTNQQIILLGFNEFICFSINKSNEYTFTKTIKINKGFRTLVQIQESKILCYFYYNYHPMDSEDKCVVGLFNIDKLKFEDFLYPKTQCEAFSHFIGNWIDVGRNHFVIINPCKYEAYIYNFSLKPIDTISYLPPNWVDINKKEIDLVYGYNKQAIMAVKNIDNQYSRVEKIFFLNDSTLLISSKMPHSKFDFRTIDIWKKNKHAKWDLKLNQRINTNIELEDSNKLVTHSNLTFDEITYSGPSMIHSNKFYYFSKALICPSIGLNFGLNKQLINNANETHQFRSGFKVYSIHAD